MVRAVGGELAGFLLTREGYKVKKLEGDRLVSEVLGLALVR
ncbi:MAG: hypothetical protein AB4040_02285 [Synechococcus sp.]